MKGAIWLPLSIFVTGAAGFVIGAWMYPIPPYSNVGPGAAVSLLFLFGGVVAGLGIMERDGK